MARFNELQGSFSFGELSPTLEGRTDTREYLKGCSSTLNMMPTKTGGITRRPPLYQVATGWITPPGRLFPFTDSNGVDYVLSFAAVVGNGIAVQAHGFGIIPTVTKSSGVNNSGVHKVFRYAHSVQIGDLLIITMNQGTTGDAVSQPLVVTYNTATNAFNVMLWIEFVTGQQADFWNGVAYLGENITTTTLQPVSSSTILQSSVAFFSAADIGRYFKLHNGVVFTTGFISATQMNITVVKTLSATTATTVWAQDAWNTRFGWPRTLTAHRSRLIFGSTSNNPDSIWCSRVGNIASFGTRISSDTDFSTFSANTANPFTRTISGNSIASVEWMLSGKVLDIGTSTAEYALLDGEDGFTSTGAQLTAISTYGSFPVQPVKVGASTLFVDASGRRVREMTYSDEKQATITNDKMILASHLLGTQGITPDSIVVMEWAPTLDTLIVLTLYGKVYSFSYDPTAQENFAGWSRFEHRATTNSIFSSLACARRQVVVVATSGFNAAVLSMNTIAFSFPEATPYLDWFTIGVSYNEITDVLSIPNSLLTGATAVLYSLTDRAISTSFTVPFSGQILDASTVFPGFSLAGPIGIGCTYLSEVTTMTLASGAYAAYPATTQQQILRIDRVSVRCYKTGSFRIGTSSSELYDIEFKDAVFDADNLYTGVSTVNVQNTAEFDRRVFIKQESHLPLQIIGITYRGVSVGE
jgi:hypothetical protein